ncbi:MAG: acyl-CoA dehydrogenase [Deltaproteobacteria bacterium]|nr:acyl-CoA dehydrogenase [Deltaproteobacteria bacterium]
MTQAVNRFKADLREIRFVLFELLKFEDILGKQPFASWGRDEVDMVLTEIDRFAREVTGPLNPVGDRHGCRLEKGHVFTPPGFKDAWSKLYEAGWRSLSAAEDHGGQGAPFTLNAMAEEFLCGSNPAFAIYSGLATGAAEVIATFGTKEQQHNYLVNMFNGKWGGTMCLTEPQAGSDVGAAKTVAKRLPDGLYSISGTKIFITGGDHDMAENIVHLVLARIEGAPPGTKGLSLFIVPKRRISADGTLGEDNDVSVGSIEHKMGINGSATCVLNFGENDRCVGELVGTQEHVGMGQMFKLMNGARIAVAIQSLGVASSAYLNALQYARERRQGSHITQWKDASAERVPILMHPDVRRMLLDMKSRVEGIRMLIYKLTMHEDRATALASDDKQAGYHHGQVELLTPISKSYASDQAFRVCETAIQVFGGAGFLKDHPVEQCCRDAKIFSIYEGTNHIQAMDLVGRKLGMQGSQHFRAFLGDIGAFVAAHSSHPVLGNDIKSLGKTSEALGASAMQLLGWFQSGRIAMVPLVANRFLEMMAETAIAWLLLDAARVAEEASATLPEGHADRAFYQGKRHSALYYSRNVLPGVFYKAKTLQTEDLSALEIPDEAFATV